MRKIFTLSLVLFLGFLKAQITVKNDDYIFVDDRVVFSENYLNLEAANSRFYLRSEAQLIQGSVNTANLGIGKLSVYQNGNVGAHEYNYWCSPIGDISNSSSNNAFGISLLNDIVDLTNSNPATFNHNSSYNGTANPLNIEPYWIWKFIASDEYSEWIQIQGMTNINPGEGFTMKGTDGISSNNSGDNQNYDFRGKPNNGTISIPVLTNQFTLVGNPYPSALDAVAYIHDIENTSVINGTLYYWEQDPDVNSHYIEDYDGGYATYTISSDGSVETYVPAMFYRYHGDGTINTYGSGIASGKIPKRYIPIGQGFMVEGISNGNVKAKNSHRVYVKESNSESAFFRSGSSTTDQSISESIGNNSRLRFNVTFNDSYTRQIVQTFTSQASANFDYGLESINNNLLPKDAFFSDEEFNYIAQANNFNIEMTIPIKFILNEMTQVNLNLIDHYNFEEDPEIFIYDSLNDTYVNLKNNVFDIVLNQGEYFNRFYIVFQNNNHLGSNEEDFNQLSLRYNYLNNQIQITNPENIELNHINVYDISGKIIESNSIRSNSSIYRKTLLNLSSGNYIIECIYNGHQKKALKFIKN